MTINLPESLKIIIQIVSNLIAFKLLTVSLPWIRGKGCGRGKGASLATDHIYTHLTRARCSRSCCCFCCRRSVGKQLPSGRKTRKGKAAERVRRGKSCLRPFKDLCAQDTHTHTHEWKGEGQTKRCDLNTCCADKA